MFSCDGDVDHISHDKLVMEQENGPDLKDLCQRSLTFQESEEVPVCFYKHNGVLMRKWGPPDAPANEFQVVHQIVVHKVYHKEVSSIAHESPMARHLIGFGIISGALPLEKMFLNTVDPVILVR